MNARFPRSQLVRETTVSSVSGEGEGRREREKEIIGVDSGTGNVTAGTKERDFVTIGISIVVRCISRKSVYKVCTFY